MGTRTRTAMVWIGLALLCAGCSPINDPNATSVPDGPAAEWAGVYTGLCLFTCDDLGCFEREMDATLRLTQALDEIHVQLHMRPNMAYSPAFSITGPVGSGSIINFHIEREGVYIYHADINRSGDHVTGALWVTDLEDHRFWEVFCIEVDR